jgi:hypothetical protein
MKPKENPEDKAARLRERKMSEIEQATAAGLSSDLRSTYNFGTIGQLVPPSVFQTIRPPTSTTASTLTRPRK